MVHQSSVAAPLPPPRPFDLGANRSTLVVVAAVSLPPQHVVMPPRRPDFQASAEKALYFAGPPPRRPTGAFDRLKPVKSAATED